MEERLLALDVGDRRIGIAVSDPLGLTAQPVETYTRVGYGPDARRVASLCERYGTRRVLCGLPRNMDGTRGFQADKVREFAEKLEEAGLTVEYWDERLTTVVAERALLEADMRRDKRKGKIDMVAAVVILQSYLDARAARARSIEAAENTENMKDMAEFEEFENPEEPDELEELDGAGDEDGAFELTDEDGNVSRFALTARIEYRGETYVLLAALEDGVDVSAGDSVVLLETRDEQGDICYSSLEDEALVEAVYAAYMKESEEG